MRSHSIKKIENYESLIVRTPKFKFNFSRGKTDCNVVRF